eukprot:763418-Hanusia_phi.AAC.5
MEDDLNVGTLAMLIPKPWIDPGTQRKITAAKMSALCRHGGRRIYEAEALEGYSGDVGKVVERGCGYHSQWMRLCGPMTMAMTALCLMVCEPSSSLIASSSRAQAASSVNSAAVREQARRRPRSGYTALTDHFGEENMQAREAGEDELRRIGYSRIPSRLVIGILKCDHRVLVVVVGEAGVFIRSSDKNRWEILDTEPRMDETAEDAARRVFQEHFDQSPSELERTGTLTLVSGGESATQVRAKRAVERKER